MATENKNLSAYDKDNLPSAEPYVFGIVVSEWNNHITYALRDGAIETLLDLGADESNIITANVPGSFELVFGGKLMCEQYVDAVIVIGSVIRGETAHFDYVCQGVTHGIKDLNIEYDTPVIFCVLTDDNEQQALDRAGGKHGNKGVEAAVAAVQMASLNAALGEDDSLSDDFPSLN
ncbi:6,7-dimethyl-8-ribityllumazine synthase [Flavobacteriaceae bacterium Ap0902]|nr:6,7-dimethyl-8-ribityllumazine synthase [Flavobacteriaceae bacterium Ap0902]